MCVGKILARRRQCHRDGRALAGHALDVEPAALRGAAWGLTIAVEAAGHPAGRIADPPGICQDIPTIRRLSCRKPLSGGGGKISPSLSPRSAPEKQGWPMASR